MNRRDFLTAVGGASAVSMMNIPNLLAANGNTTSLYVKGLVMMSVADPSVVRLGFPKAPGHKATLEVVAQSGSKRLLNFRGTGTVESGLAFSNTTIKVPELVSMKEFYGKNYRSLIAECPTLITIPRNAIQSITTANVSDERYTFVRADNGQEVDTFRRRQIAETIKIDLSSSAVLKLDNGKLSIPLNGARELHADYSPAEMASNDGGYAEHFQHYFTYIERPAAADFDVVPKKLGANSSPTPRVGNSFAMYYPWTFCYMVEI